MKVAHLWAGATTGRINFHFSTIFRLFSDEIFQAIFYLLFIVTYRYCHCNVPTEELHTITL